MSHAKRESYTKKAAVIEMLKDALQFEKDGHFASAITLAGAAEEAMPRPAVGVETGRIVLKKLILDDEESAGQVVNFTRNWLKHNGGEISQYSSVYDFPYMAIVMLIVAVDRYECVYGKINMAIVFGDDISVYLEKKLDAETPVSKALV